MEYNTHSIDFGGFYESPFQQAIDNEIEQAIEYALEQAGIPSKLEGECLRAVGDDIVWDFDESGFRITLCEQWLGAMQCWLADKYGISWETCGFKLGSAQFTIYSPRMYNFETDSIEAELPMSFLQACWQAIKGLDDFREYVESYTTSYDGYRSFYSFGDVFDGNDDLSGKPNTAKRIYIMKFLSDTFLNDDEATDEWFWCDLVLGSCDLDTTLIEAYKKWHLDYQLKHGETPRCEETQALAL